jgi:predicted RNA-binding protein with PIN domain
MYGTYTGMIRKLVFGGHYVQGVSKICTHYEVQKISLTKSAVDI